MKRRIHKLKTWPMLFKEVKAGRKTFEIRRNDRKFQIGDLLLLEEYLPTNGTYTGSYTYMEVTYVMDGDKFGLEKGFVGMSIIPFTEQVHNVA